MWKIILLVAFLGGMCNGCRYRKRECPDYTVLELHSDYEVRSYPAITWAVTRESASSRREAQKNAFMRLFHYISGENDRKQKMNMTVPVRMQFTSTEDQTQVEMSFVVPSKFAAQPPIPDDSLVEMNHDEPKQYAVRRFSGYAWRRRTWIEEAEMLRDSVKNDLAVDSDNYYEVGYDAPFVLFNRRNEIWMVKNSNEI